MSTAVVQVRWLLLDGISAASWAALELLLEDAERARASRFHFERDRRAYIAAHALLRAMLSTQVPRAPIEWRFSTNEYGKPEVVLEAGDPPLRFNLSHGAGLVAVAVTLTHDVGVDVEAVDPARLGQDLAERTFASAEVELLCALTQEDQAEARFAIWTLKEAVIKAMGRGLSVPLDAFAISLDPLQILFSDVLDEVPERWLLRRMKPSPAHALALALRHPDPAAVSVGISSISVLEILDLAHQARRGG